MKLVPGFHRIGPSGLELLPCYSPKPMTLCALWRGVSTSVSSLRVVAGLSFSRYASDLPHWSGFDHHVLLRRWFEFRLLLWRAFTACGLQSLYTLELLTVFLFPPSACRFVRLRLLIDCDPPIRAVQLRGGVS